MGCVKSVLTIAGTDPSGGAGIQADIKTIAAHKLYAESVITSLVAQNTTGVYEIYDVDPEFVKKQIEVVFEDIRPDAVKIGMVSNTEIVEAIASSLVKFSAQNIVVDPVMVATSGNSLIADEAVHALINKLIPLASVITPNVAEAEVLSGIKIANEADMVRAAHIILDKVSEETVDGESSGGLSFNNPYDRDFEEAVASQPSGSLSVLVKGGHQTRNDNSANDFLLDANGEEIWLCGERINTKNTHGTGCTLSAAIACGLACDQSVEDACRKAKAYITGALSNDLNIGRGSGPVNHMWRY